ncbi:hypothetical protein T552_03008 [Pneumocystis carinii B80]|uniref:Importin N-terminal domain-containing protein n=1 Tax=Pneumocystis carinii (strain B80) TaxID=1408658 RepID=A0A0W4ZCG4_PNEC8|nr:hypothetical protein T552_03008 [Pneumocystis carinii B80]KTW26114.1 hypothetical protein T552_03008 [Pneumocystis carinii B80]
MMHETIIETLYGSVSQDILIVKAAEEKLKSWETVPGFYLSLQDIFMEKGLPNNVRWISIIYLKNGIDRYWRKSAKNALSLDEKERIRKRVLQCSIEENHLLAVQNSILAAKIARLDFPNDWPFLFEELSLMIMESIASKSYTFQQRHLYTLYQIVKNLCASRLVRAKYNLQQITPKLFELVSEIFKNYTDQWIYTVQSNFSESEIFPFLQISHICLKILRRLIIYGFEYPYKNENAQFFFQLSYKYLKIYFDLCKHLKEKISFLYSHIILFGKMFLNFSSTQSTSIFLMPNSIEIVLTYLNIIEENANIFTEQDTEYVNFIYKIVIQGLLLIKSSVKFLHNSDILLEFKLGEYKQEIEKTYKILKENLFNSEILQRIFEILITKFIVLKPNDLFAWEEDPEQWLLTEEKQSWEYELRPCAESLFIDIFSIYNNVLSNFLISLLQAVEITFDENTFFLKEAVYNAFGLSICFLPDSVDFNYIFMNFLSKDIQIQNSRISKIIYRRILILISQWVSSKSSKNIQNNIYTIIERFLGPYEESNDLIVQFTASMSLKQCVDELDFEKEQFYPYLKNILDGLLHLINRCKLSDSKLKVLEVINIIIERMGQQISPYIQSIVDILPSLWENSEEGHLIKATVIVTLTKLIKSLREESGKYHPLVMQLIRYSIGSSMNTYIYLMEDALELWHALLQETQNSSFEVLSLIPLAITCLDHGDDILKKVFYIFESYILLSGNEFMKLYSLQFLTKLSNLLGELRLDVFYIIIKVLDLAFQTTSIHLYSDELIKSRFIFKILESIIINQEPKPIIIQYFSLISRISMQDPCIIFDFLAKFSFQQDISSNEEIINNFINTWISTFDNIGNPKYRKLNVMGITSLLITNNPYILANIKSLINIWSETLSEINENKEGDALIYWNTQDDENDLDITNNPEMARRQQLIKQDPIHTTHLETYIHQFFFSCVEKNNGLEQFKINY